MSQIYVAILTYLSRAPVSVATFPDFCLFLSLVLLATRLILWFISSGLGIICVVVFVKFWGKCFPVGKALPPSLPSSSFLLRLCNRQSGAICDQQLTADLAARAVSVVTQKSNL